MSEARIRWSLGAKLTMVGAPFLLLALLSTAATLWVSWQLDGGAAAVNEAGRMRMQAYRMALTADMRETQELRKLAEEFDHSLGLLREGDMERPLFIPWDDNIRSNFSSVEGDWRNFKANWVTRPATSLQSLRAEAAHFVADIDILVARIEAHISRWTSVMHLLQMGVLALALFGSAVLLFTGYLFVLEPVYLLNHAIRRIQAGDLGVRVSKVSSDEFGTLSEGFNEMAEHLQSMYRNLESRVLEKTAELEIKRERLEALYDITALVARTTSLDELARQFCQHALRIAHADGIAIRWSDQANRRYIILAASGLPPAMIEEEQCLLAGTCSCGSLQPDSMLKVTPIHALPQNSLKHCASAGFSTVVNVPIRLHERLMGEVSLFYHASVTLSEAERSLLEALNSHLASGMENLRLNALEKEAAVSEERQMLASELHDSIAQSLVFLKIQVQLMRDAMADGSASEISAILEEIDIGVRECYGDVRELLLHFRTRANLEDIEHALAITLKKFEHQSGVKATLTIAGNGLPLAPDLQLQVLHIVQESLSNVRKHAHATHVWLMVQQQPVWRFEIRDNGIGFDQDGHRCDETHVGLRIMSERAKRINAALDVISTVGHGSSIVLTLAPSAQPQSAQSLQPAQQAVSI